MLRVFVRAPGLWLGPFFFGMAASLFRGGALVAWVAVVLWDIEARGKVLVWSCVLGMCWGMFVLPMNESRLSWTAWIVGDDAARVFLQAEESATVLRWRAWGAERLKQSLPTREASLATALLYGENTFSSKDKRLIREIGLSHMAAVSGSNLSFLLLFLFTVSGWKKLPLRWGVWVRQGLILLCVVGTGAASSMVRAGVMASLATWAGVVGRRSRFLRSLLVSAALILCLEPRRILVDLGWQFSTCACLGLCMATTTEQRPSSIFQALRVSFWASLWTIPIQLWRFQSWSWIGVVATVALMPVLEMIQVGTVALLVFPHPFIGSVLSVFLAAVWQAFEYLRAMQAPMQGATGGGAYLSLYIPLGLLLIHKNTQSWGQDVSDVLDVSLWIWGKTVVRWACSVPSFLDTCPDLAIPLIVSMLKTSARTDGSNAS